MNLPEEIWEVILFQVLYDRRCSMCMIVVGLAAPRNDGGTADQGVQSSLHTQSIMRQYTPVPCPFLFLFISRSLSLILDPFSILEFPLMSQFCPPR